MMKKAVSTLLISSMLSMSMFTSAMAGELTVASTINNIVVDAHSLEDVYNRYASVTEEEAIVMLMNDFGFTQSEVAELIAISKQGAETPSTRASYIEGTLPSSAAIGTVVKIKYILDFKELYDIAKLTKFLAKQVGGGAAGVAVAATIAQVVFAAFRQGGVNYAKVTVSYTYGYTNDGVLGWTPGYTEYTYW